MIHVFPLPKAIDHNQDNDGENEYNDAMTIRWQLNLMKVFKQNQPE